MKLKGGILIIGSLLWDTTEKARIVWRSKRLIIEHRIHVFAPIRYGRRSGESKNLTMIFSKDCEEINNLGMAYLVPIKNKSITSFKGIENQARFLSEAENIKDNKLKKGIKKEWCTIGIKFNPRLDKNLKQSMLEKWKSKIKSDGGLNKLSIYKDVLTDNGEININWISSVNKNDQSLVNEFDFILATCTVPTEETYPNAGIIAKDIVADPRQYFYNNIKNGIFTFQDTEVLRKTITDQQI